MSLLREIQSAAIDSDANLATLLRKCKVLGARLGSDEFKAWVDNELSGYSNNTLVPDYRILHVNSKGHFAGPFGAVMRDADVPLSCIPEEFRSGFSRAVMAEPVASIELLVKESTLGLA